uniref:Uncharacterized protein n=1 Tax=Rhodnius prolixus TaxID=13249 RepID=A0A4P6D908_RHOPR
MSCPLISEFPAVDQDDWCCSLIDRKGWKKVILNLMVVLFYQTLRACYKCDLNGVIDKQSTSSYMFLVATTLWLTATDIQPKCLYIWPWFVHVYDIIAVTVLANLTLNYIWTELLLFINTISYHIFVYSEDTKLGAIYQCIFDTDDGYICLSDVIAFFILIWVLCGLGVLCNAQAFFQSLIGKLHSDADLCDPMDLEVARRLLQCCCDQSNMNTRTSS